MKSSFLCLLLLLLQILIIPLFVDSWYFLPVISETKNQWARDDPAFVVILILFLVFATSAYCAA